MSAHTHAGFADTLRRFGIVPTTPIDPQAGRFAKFAIEGDDPLRPSGWARLSDDRRVVQFGSHRTGIKGKWQDPGVPRAKLDAGERAAIAQRIAAQRERESEVAVQVRAMWDQCRKANDWHPALRRLGHGLLSYGVRECGNAILVPMIDADWRLWNLLKIYAVEGAPQRHPFKHGRRAGLFWAHALPIDDSAPEKPLVIADSYEAASSIHAPTGLPVVSSMRTENLAEVASIMRRRFPRREIIVAAHDDRHIEAMPRLTAATRAAHAIGARVATPLPIASWFASEGIGFDCLQLGDIIERIAAAERIGGAA